MVKAALSTANIHRAKATVQNLILSVSGIEGSYTLKLEDVICSSFQKCD